jgi:hypothetical protein
MASITKTTLMASTANNFLLEGRVFAPNLRVNKGLNLR